MTGLPAAKQHIILRPAKLPGFVLMIFLARAAIGIRTGLLELSARYPEMKYWLEFALIALLMPAALIGVAAGLAG